MMNDLKTYTQLLVDGAQQLNLSLSSQQVEIFSVYLQQLMKWNETFNLTAIRKPQDVIHKHFLDSLSIASYVEGGCVIDVGSGAGFPGLPLAIYYPHKKFVLLDSNGKKTRFLTQIKTELVLSNVTVHLSRVEEYKENFDCVITRAFSDLKGFVEKTAHLCTDEGYWLAMKGQYPKEEINMLPTNVNVIGVHALQIPGVDGARHVVVMKKSGECE